MLPFTKEHLSTSNHANKDRIVRRGSPIKKWTTVIVFGEKNNWLCPKLNSLFYTTSTWYMLNIWYMQLVQVVHYAVHIVHCSIYCPVTVCDCNIHMIYPWYLSLHVTNWPVCHFHDFTVNFQNSMDLPPDKAKLLKGYDDDKKWELICDQVTSLFILIQWVLNRRQSLTYTWYT